MNVHPSAALPGKTKDLAEPQSGPLSFSFGSEEWVEDARNQMGRNPFSLVFDATSNIFGLTLSRAMSSCQKE